MRKISKADAELAEAARQKAGGPSKLAVIFKVSKQAAGEWGTIRPIPRHVRPGVYEYVHGPQVPWAELTQAIVKLTEQSQQNHEQLVDLLHEVRGRPAGGVAGGASAKAR